MLVAVKECSSAREALAAAAAVRARRAAWAMPVVPSPTPVPPPPHAPMPADPEADLVAVVVEVAARTYGVAAVEVLSRSRRAPVVRARHAAAWVLRTTTKMPLLDVAEAVGLANHTSAMSAVRVVESRWLRRRVAGRIAAEVERRIGKGHNE